jgi:myo-inositol-1-phosphate synthase
MPIRVGIVGVGNCASNLIQGLSYYKDVKSKDTIPGLMHPILGGYKISDIKIVSAFDVDSRKVGKDLSEAIRQEPNNTVKIAEVPKLNVPVLKGTLFDGIGEYMTGIVNVDNKQEPVNVAKKLQDSGTEILINFLPVGSEKATRFYASEALKAGCAFLNGMPAFIASDRKWANMFTRAKIPIIGDDSKSQVGSTIIHRVLTKLCMNRGAVIDKTYQLNFGGNSDFLTMLERKRLKSKKISKTEAVQSQMTKKLPDEKIHIGPSDFVPWLESRKIAYIRIEGRLFGDVPFNIETRLDVEDKANSSGVLVDSIRCLKVALDRGIGGPLISASAYFCKHPPIQMSDDEARKKVEMFIDGKIER